MDFHFNDKALITKAIEIVRSVPLSFSLILIDLWEYDCERANYNNAISPNEEQTIELLRKNAGRINEAIKSLTDCQNGR